MSDVELKAIQGDIATKSADALVNAAGTSLRMGSGVAGALRAAAGEEINREAMEKGPIELGEVAVTDAYALDAEYVIHAAAMPHYGDGKATAESIQRATKNTLEAADRLGCRSIVSPALGCGVAGFDVADGAEIISETIAEYEPEELKEVRLIGYSQDEYEVISSTVADDRTDP